MQKKISKKRKRISSSTAAIIGSIIILIGGFFISYNYIKAKKLFAYDYITNVFAMENNKDILESDGEIKELENNDDIGEISNEYIGYLKIPKINLVKGFMDKRSSLNHVDKNIALMKEANYPDVDKGNLIIAGHSGSAWNAYFDNLRKLSLGDTMEVSYKGNKYIYKLKKIYKQPKIGKIAIYRDYDKTTLTLITCTNFDRYTQTIYISELESVEKE